jgi:peptidoglycan/LPS O-acetylase OafA/YrhL
MSVFRPTPIAGKLQSLDGLRAIAIILVFFCHISDLVPTVNLPSYYLQWYLSQGWFGVDLFFVLSGFLITGILIDTREAENYFSGFYARRVLRIFPLYYATLIGLLVLAQILGRTHASGAAEISRQLPLPEDRWTYFCFLTNWIGLWKAQWDTHFQSILAHFWSLAVEEQFYFFWPFLVWIMRPRSIPWIAAGLAGLSAVIRLGWVAHIGVQMLIAPQSVAVQIATICRLDGLFIGALCAYLFREPKIMPRIYKWLPWIATLGIGSCFAVFSAMLFFPRRAGMFLYGPTPAVDHSLGDAVRLFLECGGFTLLALGFGGVVLLAAYTETEDTWMQRLLQSRFLAPIGTYSYGIYVFHVPILGLARTYLLPRLTANTAAEFVLNNCAFILLAAVACFVIPALSYEFFEKKILRYKRYFGPRYAPATGNRSAEPISISSA